MRWTTAVVSLECAGVILLALVLGVGASAGGEDLWGYGVQLLVAAIPLAFAIIVARRAPGHAEGPLLGAAALAFVATMLPPDPAGGPFAGIWMLLYLPLALLLLVVPEGRSASREWAGVGWAIVAVVAVFIVVVAGQVLVPSAAEPLVIVSLVLLLPFLGLLVCCAIAPIARYRRADESTRLRLRWVFLAGLSLPFTLLLCWSSYLVLGGPELVGIGLTLMYIAIPAGVTVSLVNPRLFEVDRAAVATITAFVLSSMVLLVLSAASAIVGTALIAWSAPAALGLTVLVTVVAVLAFTPLRRWFDRILYPERGRAIAALRQLTEQVDRGLADPEEVQQTLRVALRDPGLLVAFRSISSGETVGLDGEPAVVTEVAAVLRIRGEEIGAIMPSPDREKRPTAAIASAAAPLVDAARLRLELRAAMTEVEASRERILRAGYAERRRLERDLHDGAQQRLVALGMRLRVLQRTWEGGADVAESLDTAVAELATAIAELRHTAHGVRPSALDDGLRAALVDLSRLAPSAIELDIHVGELPDAVATTAYYVVSEAVTNALRHAGASRIRVSVHPDGEAVRIAVADDGCGGARSAPTGGLSGLEDRVAAMGGDFLVESAPGRGTTVEARLPCVL